MNKLVYEKLKQVATEKKLITYSELNETCGLFLDFELAKDRNELGRILGEISEYEVKHKRPMLSAIVVFKNKHPPEPAYGFYNFADELKIRKKGETDQQLFFRQINECFEEWSEK